MTALTMLYWPTIQNWVITRRSMNSIQASEMRFLHSEKERTRTDNPRNEERNEDRPRDLNIASLSENIGKY